MYPFQTWQFFRVLAVLLTLYQGWFVGAKKNKHIYLPTSCRSYEYRIDGATITGSFKSSRSKCSVKLKADESNAHLKLKIKKWNNKLGATMRVYDKSDTSWGSPVGRFSGQYHTGEIVNTHSRYLTLSFDSSVLDRRYGEFSFEIVVTAVEDSFFCNEYKCNNGDCIEKDLKCDRIDHCFDNSDEKYCTYLSTSNVGKAFRIGVGVISGIVVAVIGVCVMICVAVVCCCQKSRARRGAVHQPSSTMTTVTTAQGAYPSQPGVYPTQPVAQQPYNTQYNAFSPPAYPTSAAPASNPTYAYGQGTGYTETAGMQASAPPAYDSVVTNQSNTGYPEKIN